jgi:Na+/proline symporter
VTIDALVPLGLKGLITTGFLAAVMSSADTTLVSASTILSLNVVSPLSGLSKTHQLKLTKGAVVVIGGVAALVAGFEQGIIDSLLLGYAVFVGGVALPTLASFYRDRLGITSRGAMAAVLVGGGLAIMGRIRDGLVLKAILTQKGDTLLLDLLGPQYSSILPVLISLVVMLGVSKLTRRHR